MSTVVGNFLVLVEQSLLGSYRKKIGEKEKEKREGEKKGKESDFF